MNATETTATPVKNAFQMWADRKAASKSADEIVEKAAETAKAAKPPKVKAEKPVKAPKVKAEKPVKAPKENNKKIAALRLFEANPDKNNGAIARMIAAELEITYANAYYYVTRVFKR